MMKDIEKIIEEARQEAGSYSKEKVQVELEEYINLRVENRMLKSFLGVYVGDLSLGYYEEKLRCTGTESESAFKMLWPDYYNRILEVLKKEKEEEDGSVRGNPKADE